MITGVLGAGVRDVMTFYPFVVSGRIFSNIPCCKNIWMCLNILRYKYRSQHLFLFWMPALSQDVGKAGMAVIVKKIYKKHIPIKIPE